MSENNWHHEAPPNNVLVEVETDDGIICVKARYANGYRPHWTTENGTCYHPEKFHRWRYPEKVSRREACEIAQKIMKDAEASRADYVEEEARLSKSFEDIPTRLPEQREFLAELCHEQWSHWMRYMLGECATIAKQGHAVIPKEFISKWLRQMGTAYADLSEAEKASDRREADKLLAKMCQFGTNIVTEKDI